MRVMAAKIDGGVNMHLNANGKSTLQAKRDFV